MIRNKTFQLKLSHFIIGGILLLLLVFLVKCDVEKPTPTDKYEKQKQEIERLRNNIELLKFGQKALNKQLEQQDQIVDSLNTEIKLTEQELQTTRTYYGNKIKDLTSASNSELEEFFTDRYR
jgi:septal ring factor EnvC (AmiA/AmiB activator)